MKPKMKKVPFNRPYLAGREIKYIKEAIEAGKISGDGMFTSRCHQFLEQKFNIKKALLTTSGTHALEMAFLLIDLKPGDEVIVPSYTFTSTVNAFVMRGARPVFVDIKPDTLNIDEQQIEAKITARTKAICPVHYAGVACEMKKIMKIAKQHKLFVIEDAAQAISSKYHDQYLGSIGNLGAYSFHETKNYICGEGGALLINEPQFIERAEIIREKGTNRSQFFRGVVDKYTWVDIGSSYLPSEILAAYLFAQFENMSKILNVRKKIFERYQQGLKQLELAGVAILPHLPADCTYNYHMFYLLFNTKQQREAVRLALINLNIYALFHYLPLHLSPMGLKFGYKNGDLPTTENLAGRLLRLPFYNDLKSSEQDYVIDSLVKILKDK